MSERVLRSKRVLDAGFAHGFSLRTGGVSEGAYASLNFARSSTDVREHVEENRRRFAAEVGYAGERLFEVSQVHGNVVRRVGAAEDPDDVRKDEADALMVSGAGRAVGVRVADCIPLLLADPASGAVAAVHAGWRGVAARIGPAAVAAMVEVHGARPAALIAAIGPHLRVCCFEVGDDVAERIAAEAHGADVVRREPGKKAHVDLATVLRRQLEESGVGVVDDVGGCTKHEGDRFFSYRRDGRHSGRHLGVIVAR